MSTKKLPKRSVQQSAQQPTEPEPQYAEQPAEEQPTEEQPTEYATADEQTPEQKAEARKAKLREHAKWLRSLTPRDLAVYRLSQAKEALADTLAPFALWPLDDSFRTEPLGALDMLITAVADLPDDQVPARAAIVRKPTGPKFKSGDTVTLHDKAARQYAAYWQPGAIVQIEDIADGFAGIVAQRGRRKGMVVDVPLSALLPADEEARAKILERKAKIAAAAKRRRDEQAQQPTASHA
jgi:hypothetical protein